MSKSRVTFSFKPDGCRWDKLQQSLSQTLCCVSDFLSVRLTCKVMVLLVRLFDF